MVEVVYDEEQRRWTLAERGLDFAEAGQVFGGPHVVLPDRRRDHGEPRWLVFGWLNSRMVSLVWTPRDGRRRIISLRYANERERARFAKHLGGP